MPEAKFFFANSSENRSGGGFIPMVILKSVKSHQLMASDASRRSRIYSSFLDSIFFCKRAAIHLSCLSASNTLRRL